MSQHQCLGVTSRLPLLEKGNVIVKVEISNVQSHEQVSARVKVKMEIRAKLSAVLEHVLCSTARQQKKD